MTAYYNEHDPKAAAWLRELIKQGHIAPGEVDERDIRDVLPADVLGFTQCHFFAGIGVWSYALRQAGWSDERPVWTGSCPCQPFSQAGGQGGHTDERHLWPSWFHLIEICRPRVIFGEQVASAKVTGRKNGVLTLRSREAYYRLLEDWMEGDVSDYLQDLQERIGQGAKFSEEIVDGFSGEPSCGWGEIEVNQEGFVFQPNNILGEGEIRQGSVRPHGDTVRHGPGPSVGHAITGPDTPGKRIHERKHTDGDICREHSAGELGGEQSKNDSSCATTNANSKIKSTIRETSCCDEEENRHTWLDTLFLDLGGADYTVGACVAPACGVGAPHIRQRLYFVAEGLALTKHEYKRPARRQPARERDTVRTSEASRVAKPDSGQQQGRPVGGGNELNREDAGRAESCGCASSCCEVRRMADAERVEWNRGRAGETIYKPEPVERAERLRHAGGQEQSPLAAPTPGPTNGYWRDVDWLFCKDGKWRPVEPAFEQMANGLTVVMGYLCNGIREEKKGLIYEAATNRNARQILQAMRTADAPETIWLLLGRQIGFSEATVLLACLLEQAGQLGYFIDCAKESGPEACQDVLYEVFVGEEFAGTPQGRELPEQLAGELADAVRELSQENALAVLGTLNGFPLAHKAPARVGRLRGYGNAIVAPVAQAFIESYMEISS